MTDGDVVSPEWLLQHAIYIPRRPGLHQSTRAWVKVDERGNIIAAGRKDETVFGWLISRKILTRLDEEYAVAYLGIRAAFRGRSELFISCLNNGLHGVGDAISQSVAGAIYERVAHSIGRECRKTVDYACDTYFTPGDEEEGNARLKTFKYRHAFDALSEAYDDEIESLMECQRAGRAYPPDK